MTPLHQAAQMALDALENSYLSDELRNYELQAKAIAALREALAAPQAEPVAWLVEGWHDGKLIAHIPHLTLSDAKASAAVFLQHYTTTKTVPLYAAAPPAAPADQWKAAIDDELVCCHIGTTDSFPDAKSALKNLIDWHVSVALDPAVSSDARALIDKGKAAAPVVPAVCDGGTCGLGGYCANCPKQSAAPVVREPLTDEQLRDVLRHCPSDVEQALRVRWLYAKDFARAIEAAHGITGGKP